MIFIFNLILCFLVCFQLNKQNRDFLEINEGQFCPRCPAGGPDLEKSWFFLNKRRSVLSPLPCGRPRPWKIMIFCIYTIFFTLQNCLICLVLSIGSMLVFLVLKNAVECTSQRLKRTSGARVMILFDRCNYRSAWWDDLAISLTSTFPTVTTIRRANKIEAPILVDALHFLSSYLIYIVGSC